MSAMLLRTRSHLITMIKTVSVMSVQITAKAMKLFKSLRTFKFPQNCKKLRSFKYVLNIVTCTRGISILGEVQNVEISRVTQQLLCSKSHDFLAVFALAHSKINQIA